MMPINQLCRRFLLLSVLSPLVLRDAVGFSLLKTHGLRQCDGKCPPFRFEANLKRNIQITASSSALFMTSGGGGDSSKGIVTAAGFVVIAALFVGGSILPLMDMGGGGVAPLANSVATRDQVQQVVTNEKYRLSRAAIQEKLNSVPVFYVVEGNGEIGTNLYLSYDDAVNVAGSKIIKATTLDQVE